MRKTLFSAMALLGVSAAAGMTDALSRKEEEFNNRIYGFENIRRALRRHSINHFNKGRGSIATGNRHGGAHLHQREIARRLRQRAA